jgi:nucleoside-diphosphate-sugar epimerase
LGLVSSNEQTFGKVFNVACGEYYSLNTVISVLKNELNNLGMMNSNAKIVHGPNRPGDIRDSLADITETRDVLGYTSPVSFKDGMKIYLESMYK